MIIETYNYSAESIEHHKRRTRKELETSLRGFYLWHAPNGSNQDIENLVQQGVDAAMAVLHGYPPLATLAAE